ncbi:hypothetical protein AB0D34_37785 [Streptomyces sp. NPDC048420]|uniref:hypothetical protein n=1 Tax=Streptomyces sp. NPDC048420 TaxID=3155755 RepID=UPI003428121A
MVAVIDEQDAPDALTNRVDGCIAGHRAEIRPIPRSATRHAKSAQPGGLDVQEVTDVGDDLQRVRGGEPMSVVDLRGEDAAVVGTVELRQGHRDRPMSGVPNRFRGTDES